MTTTNDAAGAIPAGYKIATGVSIAKLRACNLPEKEVAQFEKYAALMDPEANLAKWLPKAETEREAQWKTRLTLADWSPRCPELVALFLGALTRREPKITTNKKDGGGTNVAQVGRLTDIKGTMEWVDQALTELLVYKRCALVLTQTITAQKNSVTGETWQDEKSRANSRAFVTVFGAMEILDWRFDEDGRLAMIKLKSCEDVRIAWNQAATAIERYYIYEMRQPMQEEPAAVEQPAGQPKDSPQSKMAPVAHLEIYDVYPGDRIFEREGITLTVTDRLPVVLLEAKSLVSLIANRDLANLRAQSHRDWTLYAHAHPHAAVKSPKELYNERLNTGIAWGTGDVACLSEGEELTVYEMTGAAVGAQANAIDVRDKAVDKAMGINGGDAQAAAQSGVAINAKFRIAQERLLNGYASTIERGENELAILANRATVQWDRDFMFNPVEEAQATGILMDGLRGVPDAQRAILEGLVWRLVDRNTADRDRVKAIEDQIKNWTPSGSGGFADLAPFMNTPGAPPA